MAEETIDVDHTPTTAVALVQADPMKQVEAATAQANALMQVVKNGKLAKQIGNKQYLTVEAWQTIARFNGFLFDVEWTKDLTDEVGAKVGYIAKATLVRMTDGTRLAGAEGSCRHDETETRRDGTIYKRWSDDYAVRSMAQTRAMGKLGRMCFSWVATLAGFEPTPAEEMKEGMGQRDGGNSAPSSGSNGNSNEPKFPFGKNKDKRPSELDLATLKKEVPFWKKKAGEEGQYQAGNQKMLAAVEAAIAAKESGGKAATASKEAEGIKFNEALERLRLAKEAAMLCGALKAEGWEALKTEFNLMGKNVPTASVEKAIDRLVQLSNDHQAGTGTGEEELEPFGGQIPFAWLLPLLVAAASLATTL